MQSTQNISSLRLSSAFRNLGSLDGRNRIGLHRGTAQTDLPLESGEDPSLLHLREYRLNHILAGTKGHTFALT